MWDPITRGLIDDTPSDEEEALKAATSTPALSPLSRLSTGNYMGSADRVSRMIDAKERATMANSEADIQNTAAAISNDPIHAVSVMLGGIARGISPSTIINAARQEQQRQQQLKMQQAMNIDAHDMERRRIDLAENRQVFDQLRQQAKQGSAGEAAAYKTYMQLAPRLDDATANKWLDQMINHPSSFDPSSEAAGEKYALDALGRSGGFRAKAPAGFENTAQGQQPIPGGPRDPAEIATAAAARRQSPEQIAAAAAARRAPPRARGRAAPSRLYKTQTDTGETVWQPREAAIGRPVGPSRVQLPAPASDRPQPPAVVPPERQPTSSPTFKTKIRTDREYDALPSGTVFISPDGKTRKKP